VLAAAGLLDDRPATTHWALAGTMARMYPKVKVQPGLLFIDDGDVLTAGGGAAGMDLGLHLLRAHCGAETANRLARYMVVPPHRFGGQAQYIESPVLELDQADPVGETLTWALGRLDQVLPVETLARRAQLSRRTFDRRFREITGTAPLTWLTHQRVLRAQQLLESTQLPVEEVARRCGFSCAAALRPHFRRFTGSAQLMADDAMGERSLDDDFILDNTTLYWLTNTGGESIRFYYEDAHASRPAEPTTIPLGLAGFAGDFSGVRRFAEHDHKNITQWNLHQEPGGHYAAHQEPEVLADDIRNFYAALA